MKNPKPIRMPPPNSSIPAVSIQGLWSIGMSSKSPKELLRPVAGEQKRKYNSRQGQNESLGVLDIVSVTPIQVRSAEQERLSIPLLSIRTFCRLTVLMSSESSPLRGASESTPVHRLSILHGNSEFIIPNYPTLPSRLTPSSFCASTANSMGSSRNTCLQKPLTMMPTASSVEIPRWRQ